MLLGNSVFNVNPNFLVKIIQIKTINRIIVKKIDFNIWQGK